MKRGDVVVFVAQGDYGKPRPAVVVQSDLVIDLDSVSVAPITSTLTDREEVRPTLHPTDENGLRERSEVMVDKIQPVRRSKVGAIIGSLDSQSMESITRAIGAFFGLADAKTNR
jgi:mRNA interferase MazF